MDAGSYIADAMIMSDDFAWVDDGIADALFRLSDESTPLTISDLGWARGRVAPGNVCFPPTCGRSAGANEVPKAGASLT